MFAARSRPDVLGTIVICAASLTLGGCLGDQAGTSVAPSGNDAGGTATDGGGTSSGGTSSDGGAATGDAASASKDAGPANNCPKPTGQRPSRRSEQSGAFDPISGKLVMFGGSFAVPVNCGFPASTFETETWIYDTKCDSWRLHKGKTPPARARSAGVYRSKGPNPMLIVTGGRYRPGKSGSYTLRDDLWGYDFGNEAWIELAQTKKRPAARANASIAYDSTNDALLLFGGNTSKSGLQISAQQDTWLFDFENSAWKQLAAAQPPKRRLWAGTLYDPKRKRMVIFGGGDATAFANTAKYMDDLWALSTDGTHATWKRIDMGSNTRPDGRFWADLAYDAKNDRYIMFGGHDDKSLGNRNDLWAFTPKDGQWIVIKQGDLPNKPANGFCSFPPDFTKLEDGSPERRYAGIFAAGPNTIWLAAGKTDCGVIDDLFKLDLNGYKWTEVTSSTVGNSCIRKGGLTCNDYCF